MNTTLHVLCVEDSDEDFALIERELRKIGEPFGLSRAQDRESYEKALTFCPDVILCDHNLPRFSSTEAFRIMRAKGLTIPFILVTAIIGEEEGVRRISEGMDDYILKDRLQRLPSSIVRAVRLSRAELDREKYYNALLARERRFRAVVEHSAEAVVLCDINLEVTYASPAFSQIFNINEETARGKRLPFLIQADNDPAFTTFCEAAIHSKGKHFTEEFEVHCPGKGRMWIECNISNFAHDENVNAVVLNIRDKTARVESEESLARTQAVLAAIINNSEISYVMVDRNFKTLTYNKNAEHRYLLEFGKALKEGIVIFDYLPEHRKEGMKKLFQTALEGEKIRYETAFRQPDDTEHWYEVNIFPVMEEVSRLVGVIIATEDITPRKKGDLEKDQLTQDLLDQNKNLEQFAYIISHNLRSPVATILGLAALLEKKSFLSARDADTGIQGMAAAARTIDLVIRDLNIILQAKKAIGESAQAVNLQQLTSHVLRMYTQEMHETGSVLTTDFKAETCTCIRSYMHSVFQNLISNSLRYRKPGHPAHIKISSVDLPGKTRIEFEDNGLGFDYELHKEHVFGLYRRFHSHTDGRGMGLFMVKTQIELMGGTIWVSSQVGQGSRFTLEMPRAS